VRQISEHSHYVQGVAWDPLNEYIATQSSDRSVHIYGLKLKDGTCTLSNHGKFQKIDLPGRRISSNSPAPPDLGHRPSVTSDSHRHSSAGEGHRPSNSSEKLTIASPAPSNPGTPLTTPLPMDPPALSHSRRSSFGSSPSFRRSASPAPGPTLPLPAVRPEISSPSLNAAMGLGVKNSNIYHNETLTSFFRRLTFAPDGSLLFTPSGQYKSSHSSSQDPSKTIDEISNTVYIYTRAGFNKPPITHLPGHKKPSVAVKCSPIFYTLRQGQKPTKNITIDTSAPDVDMPLLPDPVVPTQQSSFMEPPAPLPPSHTSEPSRLQTSPKPPELDLSNTGLNPAFALPYRMVYAVATQDAVLVYDTQQQTPLCIVSNLHFTTFSDLSWYVRCMC
jgi:chromatin assembly factor 1 subunit B